VHEHVRGQDRRDRLRHWAVAGHHADRIDGPDAREQLADPTRGHVGDDVESAAHEHLRLGQRQVRRRMEDLARHPPLRQVKHPSTDERGVVDRNRDG